MSLSSVNAYQYCGTELECFITSKAVDGEDNMKYTTYGIRVSDSLGKTLYERSDISTNKAVTEGFAVLCETHFVSVIHLDDVLDDYLN